MCEYKHTHLHIHAHTHSIYIWNQEYMFALAPKQDTPIFIFHPPPSPPSPLHSACYYFQRFLLMLFLSFLNNLILTLQVEFLPIHRFNIIFFEEEKDNIILFLFFFIFFLISSHTFCSSIPKWSTDKRFFSQTGVDINYNRFRLDTFCQ